MTKAHREKGKRAAQRLESLRAAGIVPTDHGSSDTKALSRVVYDNRRKGKGKGRGKDSEPKENTVTLNPNQEVNELVEEQVEEQVENEAEEPEESEEESEDEWDVDSDDEGDGSNLNAIAARLQGAKIDDDVDLAEVEKQKEQERLKVLGQKRVERERIEAEKRSKLLAEQEEESRQAALIAVKREEGKRKRLEQERLNLEARTADDLRCPIVVIMGHVDTGKLSFRCFVIF